MRISSRIYNLNILVPAIEINWENNPKEAIKDYNVGDIISGVVLSSDLERERVTGERAVKYRVLYEMRTRIQIHILLYFSTNLRNFPNI